MGQGTGMTHIQGPLGFTDFDAEGMLIEGYDQLTQWTTYNYPYYPQHMERMGFEKDADWVEYKIYIPDAIPDKHKRISDLIQRKYNQNQEIFICQEDCPRLRTSHFRADERSIQPVVRLLCPVTAPD